MRNRGTPESFTPNVGTQVEFTLENDGDSTMRRHHGNSGTTHGGDTPTGGTEQVVF